MSYNRFWMDILWRLVGRAFLLIVSAIDLAARAAEAFESESESSQAASEATKHSESDMVAM